jgi:opacity protein-like surface antigen
MKLSQGRFPSRGSVVAVLLGLAVLQAGAVLAESKQSKQGSENATTCAQTRRDLDHPWSLSLHGGINFPQGETDSFYEGNRSLGLDLEYRVRCHFALELYYGQETLKGAPRVDDLTLDHLSLNAKVYFTGSRNGSLPYLLAGVGRYVPGSGRYGPYFGDSKIGFDVGAGWQWDLASKLAFGFDVRYHLVDFSEDRLEFTTWHAVVKYRF